MKVVVVESPAKAKTINKYLGSDYKVVASYGHVRDLPAKDGSVLPDADFAMSWEVDGKSEKHLKTILEAVRGADRLFLATDPDREGEAISWHVSEVLNSRRGPNREAFVTIIKRIQMQTNNEWIKKYYNDEAQKLLAERRHECEPFDCVLRGLSGTRTVYRISTR